jgi:hypothetical protein
MAIVHRLAQQAVFPRFAPLIAMPWRVCPSLLNRGSRYILTSFIGQSDTWSEHAGWRFP